jgi:hypothetical protein
MTLTSPTSETDLLLLLLLFGLMEYVIVAMKSGIEYRSAVNRLGATIVAMKLGIGHRSTVSLSGATIVAPSTIKRRVAQRELLLTLVQYKIVAQGMLMPLHVLVPCSVPLPVHNSSRSYLVNRKISVIFLLI